MLQNIKSTVESREFQAAIAKGANMVITLVVTSVVSNLVSQGLDTLSEKLLDKIHGQESAG